MKVICEICANLRTVFEPRFVRFVTHAMTPIVTHAMTPNDTTPTTTIGDIRVTSLFDGWLWLDGGAMFGVVPRVLWEKKNPPDALNRIRLSLRPLLVRTPTHTVVIETGVGQALQGELRQRYGLEWAGVTLDEQVRAQGVDPARVDAVICTHLHWDHAGGVCKLVNDQFTPMFPNATYFAQRGEWQTAISALGVHKASYVPRSLQPLEPRLKLIDGDGPILPGLRYVASPGHTEHHAVVFIESQGQTGVFWGDMVETTAHVPLAWTSAYDFSAGQNYATRERLYPLVVAAQAISFFYHDPMHPTGRIISSNGRYECAPVS